MGLTNDVKKEEETKAEIGEIKDEELDDLYFEPSPFSSQLYMLINTIK